jgi:prephenate dehydrogenase
MKELFKQRIAILGAGNIGRMLLERLRRSGMTVRMAVYDKDPQKLAKPSKSAMRR